MKKKLLALLLIATAATCGAFAFAGCGGNDNNSENNTDTEQNDDQNDSHGEFLVNGLKFIKNSEIEYYLNDSGYSKLDGYSVSGHVDAVEHYSDISIPSTINNLPVTSIFTDALSNCTNLETVTIPDSITKIGRYAFYNCQKLEAVEIPNTVTTIDSYAFSGCGLKSISIPESVTSLSIGTFKNCKRLEQINLNDSLKSIGKEAFINCSAISEINIPNNINSIGESAFRNCTKLESATIPDNVNNIGEFAFRNCTKLESVTIPDSVTSIGIGTFEECTKITNATFPTFAIKYIPKDNLKTVVLTSGKIIASNAFYGCYTLKEIIFNDDLEQIHDSAFRSCFALNAVAIPDSVIVIRDSVFRDCYNLKSIEIGKSLNSIGFMVFNNCNAITNATIPALALESIPKTNLATVEVTSGEIGKLAFSGSKKLNSVKISDEVTKVDNTAFQDCTNISEVTIPTLAIASMPKNNLRTVTITSGESIGMSAFRDCHNLTRITIPDSITDIGAYAFTNCYKLFEIWNFSNLNLIKGSTSDGEIAYYAKDIYTTEAPSKQFDQGDYSYYNGGDYIYLTDYRGNEAQITLPIISNIQDYRICDYAFYGCTCLRSVTIPKCFTEIRRYAFSDCSKLESVNIHEGVTLISDYAFKNCSNLLNITLPGSVEEIGGWAFADCSGLTDISFNGTKDQWKAISKNIDFFDIAGNLTVTCSDGKLDKNGNDIV